jgi:hypothetical protein
MQGAVSRRVGEHSLNYKAVIVCRSPVARADAPRAMQRICIPAPKAVHGGAGTGIEGLQPELAPQNPDYQTENFGALGQTKKTGYSVS